MIPSGGLRIAMVGTSRPLSRTMNAPEKTPEPTKSAVLTHMDALPNGTRLGEFEVRGLLGVGGFGIVYRCYDHTLQRQVAIKEYMPSGLVGRAANLHVTAKTNLDDKPFKAGLASFIAEARLLAKFDHPSLVKVYRFWEANNTAYMAMPLYTGITLKQARAQMSGPPDEHWLRVVIWSVLEALKVLHNSNALHRDVSPDNIFLQDVGSPVLLDLGAARLAILDSNHKHTAVLKVNYAPIEQYSDSKDFAEGPWTDLYALAAVIHGCLCNEPPLPATIRIVRDRLPPVAKVIRTIQTHFGAVYSAEFAKALDHALQLQPKQRPQSVHAFAKEMKLAPVRNLMKFNWRRQLGDRVQLVRTGTPLDSMITRPVGEAVPENTIPFEGNSIMLPAFDDSSIYSTLGEGDAPPRTRYWRWAAGAVAGIFLVAGAFWVMRPAHRTEAVALMPNNAVKTVPAASASASAPVVAAPVVETQRDTASTTASPVPADPVPKAKPAPVKPRAQPRSPQTASKANTVNSVPVEDKLPNPPVSNPVPAKPEPAASSEPQRPNAESKNLVLCADSSFFSKPLCIYRECQRPEYRNLQACVEDRKKWEEREKPR